MRRAARATEGGVIEILFEFVVEVLGQVLSAMAGAVIEEALSDDTEARRVLDLVLKR